MTLQILPLELLDFDQLVHHAETGPPGDDCVAAPNPLVWPVKTQEEARVRARGAFALQKRRILRDPTVRFLKVVDTSEGIDPDDNIVALARWHHYPDGYDYEREAHWELAPDTEAGWAPLLADMNDGIASGHRDDPMATYPPPNFNVALHNFILSDMVSGRDAFRPRWIPQEKPCWILMHLVTRPSQRRRGAAALLINWGLAQSVKTKVPAYLEAGVAGRPIYARYGFQQVGDLRKLSLAKFGMDVEFEFTNMVFNP
jgi:hypothetical protein